MQDPRPTLLTAFFIFALLIIAVYSAPTMGSDRDGAGENIGVTTLGFPVLRTIALTVPIVSTIVFEVLSLNNCKHFTTP